MRKRLFRIGKKLDVEAACAGQTGRQKIRFRIGLFARKSGCRIKKGDVAGCERIL